MNDVAEGLKRLPLENLHYEAGAKFGSFAGWHMPLTYPLGVMKEHLHTRSAAGLFDISHMKLIELTGPGSGSFLDYALPLESKALAIGQSRYCYLLDENAGILDDLIVTHLAKDRFILAVNAGNAEADFIELQNRAQNFDCRLEALDRVFLALQGPQACEVLKDLDFPVDDLRFMESIEFAPDHLLSRSGYTGEDGFEIAVPISIGEALAKKILADERVEWIGLAARDSLRLEAGLCLHGNDITKDTNPAEAGLLWAIPKSLREVGSFVGAEALRTIISEGVKRKRVGLKAQTNQPVRSKAPLYDEEDNLIGEVTSGGFGPSVGAPVAMGYVSLEKSALDTIIYTKVRERKIALAISKLPFIQPRYFKG